MGVGGPAGRRRNHADEGGTADCSTHRLDNQADWKLRNNAEEMVEKPGKSSLEEEEEEEKSWEEKRREGLGRWARLGTSNVLARQQTEGLVIDTGDRWHNNSLEMVKLVY